MLSQNQDEHKTIDCSKLSLDFFALKTASNGNLSNSFSCKAGDKTAEIVFFLSKPKRKKIGLNIN